MLYSGIRVETLLKAVGALNGGVTCHCFFCVYVLLCVLYSIMFITGPSEGYTGC